MPAFPEGAQGGLDEAKHKEEEPCSATVPAWHRVPCLERCHRDGDSRSLSLSFPSPCPSWLPPGCWQQFGLGSAAVCCHDSKQLSCSPVGVWMLPGAGFRVSGSQHPPEHLPRPPGEPCSRLTLLPGTTHALSARHTSQGYTRQEGHSLVPSSAATESSLVSSTY